MSVARAHCEQAHDTNSTDQRLGILMHRVVFRELKFIFEYPQIHVVNIISLERGLHRMVSK